MRNIIPLLILSLILSCEKEVITLKQVDSITKYSNINEDLFSIESIKLEKFDIAKNINAVELSFDSKEKYSSINEDWFSIASNRSYDISTKFYHNDSLGNIINLTNMVIDSNYFVKYELYPLSNSKITILDKNKEGTNLGLLFNIKTSTPEFGFMDVKVYNKKCDTIFHYKYPFIVSTP